MLNVLRDMPEMATTERNESLRKMTIRFWKYQKRCLLWVNSFCYRPSVTREARSSQGHDIKFHCTHVYLEKLRGHFIRSFARLDGNKEQACPSLLHVHHEYQVS